MLPNLPDTQIFVWPGKPISPSLARQIDSQVIHGWNYIIPLYIDCKMWSFNCCCLSGPFARRCVGNNAAQRAPTHPPASLTVSSRNWLGGHSNAFPRLIRLPWVVRLPGQIMKAQLTLKIRGYSFIFILGFSYNPTIICSHNYRHTIQTHLLIFYTSKALVILFSLIWTFSPYLFMGGTLVHHFSSHIIPS